jgi:hypothetical protein
MSAASLLASAYGLLEPLVGHTPNVATWPEVVRVWQTLLTLAAMVLAGGYGWTVARSWAAAEPVDAVRLALRLVVPAALALFSLPLCRLALQALNAALQVLGHVTLAAPPSLGRLALATLFWWLPWLLTTLATAVLFLLRLAELALLTAVSGLAAALLATPLAHLSGLWLRTFTAALAVQFLQAVTVVLARSLAGLLGGPSTPVALLVSVAELWLLWRLPVLLPTATPAWTELTRSIPRV